MGVFYQVIPHSSSYGATRYPCCERKFGHTSASASDGCNMTSGSRNVKSLAAKRMVLLHPLVVSTLVIMITDNTPVVTRASLRKLEGIDDPGNRAIRAGEILADIQELEKAVARVRQQAIIEMRSGYGIGYGFTDAEIAMQLGISQQQVNRIRRRRSR